MSRIGYARVSLREQNPDAQHDALTAAGCIKTFTEKLSRKLGTRPELTKTLDYLRDGQDTLVITRLDRLDGSIKHLIARVEELGHRGIDLVVLEQGIDTSTIGGKLVFHIFGALAEYEVALISERTHEGLAAARARGRTGGRRPTMTPAKIKSAQQLYTAGDHTTTEIAETLGISRATLYRHLDPEHVGTRPVGRRPADPDTR